MIKNLLSVLAITFALNLNSQTGLSNMSFENWGTVFSSSQPNGWFGSTLSQQTSGAQQGASYVRITTTNTNTTGYDGVMMLAQITSSVGPIYSGVPYIQKPNSLNGFYKTSGLAIGDTVVIYSVFTKTTSPVGIGTQYISNNVGSWTSFSIPFTYFSVFNPDTIHILGMSNYKFFGGGSNAIGSTLDLDNLSLALSTSIDVMSLGTSFMVYPNPASNVLNIISKDETATSVVITDVNGKVIEEVIMENEKTRIGLENYSAGVYFYSIENKEKAILLSNKFVVTK